MRSYFIHDNEIIPYDDPKTEPSFHELSQIYQPSQSATRDTLRSLRDRRDVLLRWKADVQSSLLRSVPYADIDCAVELVWACTGRTEFERVSDLIALNEFLLARHTADTVKDIPITDFIRFHRGWARCPFHADKKPSLKYYPKENRVHCFSGCGQKNVIQVYAVLNGLSNKDAYFALKQRT